MGEEMLKKDLPLRFTWCIWEQIMQSSDKSAAYSDATHKVANFSTVQSFWKLWNHMPQPSELLEQKRMVREQPDGLHVIDAIMIFRDNVRPEWEDKLNATGGHFQFQLKPNIGELAYVRRTEVGRAFYSKSSCAAWESKGGPVCWKAGQVR